jgi:hypothetical protein
MSLLAALLITAITPGNDPDTLEWMADLPMELESWSGGEDDIVPLAKVGVRYRSWQSTFEGTLQADDEAIEGTNVDIASDLSIDDEEHISGFTAWVGLSGAGRIWVDWWDGTWEGDEVLSNSITFAGKTFTAASNVHTKMEWRALTGLYLYDLPLPTPGPVGLDLSIGAGFKFVRIYGKLESDVAPFSESGTFRAPVPVLAGAARVTLGEYFSAELEIQGLHVESWENVATGTIYDISLSAQGRYQFAFGGIGYRWFGVRLKDERADIDTVQLDLLIHGFFFELGVRF